MGKYLKSLLIIFVLAFATFSSVLGTKVLSEERITTDEKNQINPAIYGDIVVWQDGIEGEDNTDIYGYNLNTGQGFPICKEGGDQTDPAIYGDIVVWEDKRDNNWDIYGYNLKTGQEFPICKEVGDQHSPAIYGDIVVWVNEGNEQWDIYGYNLKTGQGFQITDSGYAGYPAIYGDIVVW
ncbi:MAG: cell surface protein, partial [Methanofastidiosum sp.]